MLIKGFLDVGRPRSSLQPHYMTAMVGTTAQWARFETSFRKTKRSANILGPLHTTDLYHEMQEGRYSGDDWRTLWARFPNDLRHLAFCGVLVLNQTDYDATFPDHQARRALSPNDSEFGVCFRYSLKTLVEEVLTRYRAQRPEIMLYVEKEQGAGVASNLWRAFSNECLPPNMRSMMEGVHLVPKGPSPLEAADMLAWKLGKFDTDPCLVTQVARSMAESSDAEMLPNAYRIDIGRNQLEDLKAGLAFDATTRRFKRHQAQGSI